MSRIIVIIMHIYTGGYPNNPGSNPAQPGGLSTKDCVVVNGLKDALCFAFRSDNSGPPVDFQVCYVNPLDKIREFFVVWAS